MNRSVPAGLVATLRVSNVVVPPVAKVDGKLTAPPDTAVKVPVELIVQPRICWVEPNAAYRNCFCAPAMPMPESALGVTGAVTFAFIVQLAGLSLSFHV